MGSAGYSLLEARFLVAAYLLPIFLSVYDLLIPKTVDLITANPAGINFSTRHLLRYLSKS